MIQKYYDITLIKTKIMATEKIKIEVKKGDVNRALKQFKRKVMDSGHLQ